MLKKTKTWSVFIQHIYGCQNEFIVSMDNSWTTEFINIDYCLVNSLTIHWLLNSLIGCILNILALAKLFLEGKGLLYNSWEKKIDNLVASGHDVDQLEIFAGATINCYPEHFDTAH